MNSPSLLIKAVLFVPSKDTEIVWYLCLDWLFKEIEPTTVFVDDRLIYDIYYLLIKVKFINIENTKYDNILIFELLFNIINIK